MRTLQPIVEQQALTSAFQVSAMCVLVTDYANLGKSPHGSVLKVLQWYRT